MASYVKHQKALEARRKMRRSKSKKESGDVLLDICTGGAGSQLPDEVMEEGSESSASSVAGVSDSTFESYIDCRLLEQDSKLDTKFDSFAMTFASIIRQEMKSLIAEIPRPLVYL